MNPFKLKNLKEQIENIKKLMGEQHSTPRPPGMSTKQNAGAYIGVPFKDLEDINKHREDSVLAGDVYTDLPPEGDITPTSQDTWMTFTDPVTGEPSKTDTHVPTLLTPTPTTDPWVQTFITHDEPGYDTPLTPPTTQVTGDTFTGDTTFTGETIPCTEIESHANSLGIQSGVPGVDGTTMTAADQFCIKCQSGSFAGDPMCDCCDTDYTYEDWNEVTYEPPVTEELCESVFPTTVNLNWGGLQISATFPYTTSELINFLVNGTTGTDNNTVYTNVNGMEGTTQLPNLPLGYQAPYDSMDGFLQTLYPNGAGNFQWDGTNLVPTTENAYESINSLIITDPMTGVEFDLFQEEQNFNLENWMPNLEQFIGLVNSWGEILSECTPVSPGDIETWQSFNDVTGVGEPSDDTSPSMGDAAMDTPLTLSEFVLTRK